MNKKIVALAVSSVIIFGSNGVLATDKASTKQAVKPVSKVVSPVDRMFNLMYGTDSYTYDFKMPMVTKVVPQGETKETKVEINITMNGAVVGQKNPKTMKQDIKVNYQIKNEDLKTAIGTNKINLGLDMKTVGEDYFFNLKEYPDLVNVIVDLSKIKGQWIKLTSDDLANFIKMLPEDGNNNDLLMSSLNMEKQAEKQKEIVNLMKKHKVIVVGKKLSNGKVGKTVVDRWNFSLNKLGMAKFMIDMNKLYGTPMTKAEIEDMNNGLRSFNFKTGELAIGRNNEVLVLKLTGVNNDIDGDKQTKDSLTMNFDWTMRDFNSKKIKVSTPIKAISVNEVSNLVKLNIDANTLEESAK
ncbi:MAG: hypothetical protein PHR00_01520 [Patescibacteria group bacterium]|nr:hypothetical protein [Patescibacteria group bacterium]